MEGRVKMSEKNQENIIPQSSEPVAAEQVQEMPSTSIKAVVVSEHCWYCQSLKDRLKEKGLIDKVQFIDVASKEGKKIVEESNISGIPECVIIVEKDGVKQTRVCNDEEFKKLIEEGV